MTEPAALDVRSQPWSSLVEMLEFRASDTPKRTAFHFLVDGERELEEIDFAQLAARCRAVARALRGLDLRPGDRVLLLYPPGLDFIAGFLGCLYAGVVAVPAYPPDPTALERSLPRLQAILRDADPQCVVTTAPIVALRQDLTPKAPELARLAWLATDTLDPEPQPFSPLCVGAERDLVMLQYTSGSTGDPKGVRLTNANLLDNLSLIHRRFEHEETSRGVIWLPPYHDMGLIGGILQPIFAAMPTLLMSPYAFLEKPLRWLRAISDYSATTSGGPNFAYELAVRRVKPEEREGLDLSQWKVAFCGAEPVRIDVLERFADAYAPHGFQAEALMPVYGLAEGTLYACGPIAGTGARALALDRDALEAGRAEPAAAGDPEALSITTCGEPNLGQPLRIVDPGTGEPCCDGEVGEIWLSGPSVADGYWNRPHATEETFQARLCGGGEMTWLRTGDLGFVRDGSFYVYGRIKDLIVVRGRNISPQDLEATSELSAPGLRLGCSAAFPIDLGDREGVAIAQEVRDPAWPDHDLTIEAIRRAVARDNDVALDLVVLLPPRSIPKTSSGKVQRSATRKIIECGDVALVCDWRSGTEVAAEGPPSCETLEVEGPDVALARTERWLRIRIARLLGLGDPLRIPSDARMGALGLDSLGAIELKGGVESELGVSLVLHEMLAAEGIRELARLIVAHLDAARLDATEPDTGASVEPDPANRYESFPLTDLQGAYWAGRSGFFEGGDVASHGYFEFESESGALDLVRLGRAWNALVRRHDALRTIVPSHREQRVLEHVPEYEIAYHDLSGLPPDACDRRLEEARERMSHRLVPLDAWPLFELCAHGLPGGRLRLHVSIDYFVADATSLILLIRDWASLYQEIDASLPPLRLAFRDYVLAERAAESSPRHRRSEEYWSQRLPELPLAPVLPTRSHAVATRRPRIVRRSVRLPVDAWTRILERAAERGLTPSVVLLTAFSEVLATWSESTRFTVNVTHLSRRPVHPDVDRVVGQFASFLPIAVDPRPEAFVSTAREIQQTLLEALEHREIGGVRILRMLRELTGGRTEAFWPIVFTSALQDLHDMEWLGEEVFSVTQTPQVWIDHQVFQRSGQLELHWDVAEDRFQPGVPDQMWSGYIDLLRRLADPVVEWDGVLDEGLVPGPRVLEDSVHEGAPSRSGSVALGREPLLLHERVETHLAQRAEEVALVAHDRTLSYRVLLARAADLAQRLFDAGVGSGATVAIVMRKGWEQIVALLAISRCGAIAVPLDADEPDGRLSDLLEDCAASIALTQTSVDASRTWPVSLAKLCVDELVDPVDPLANAPSLAPTDDVAVLIYTSGSTGRPKGVMLTHTGIGNALDETIKHFGIHGEDRALGVTMLHHDMALFDVFAVLGVGGTLVLPDPRRRREPRHWIELLERERITLWNSVPATFEMLLAEVESRDLELPDTLRLVFLGGDWIPLDLPGRVARLGRRARVVSVGGPTETTLWNIWYEVDRDGPIDPNWTSVPYGRPIANATYHVLDERMRNRPTWVPGELYCSGVGLARRYWRDEKRTRQSFLRHPRTGERLYRTGDIGRFLPDGNIELLGRRDLQVQVQGHRIELREVEVVLERHPAVERAVVVAVGEPKGSKRLAACVALAPETSLDTADLREYARDRLPRVMVPGRIDILDALPLTRNGKLDRSALARRLTATVREASPPADRVAPLPARRGTRARIEAIVLDVLDVDELDGTTDLVDLGANSLDMLRTANQLQAEFGFRPTIDEFFELSTIGALVEYFEARQHRETGGASKPDVRPGPEPSTIEALIDGFEGIVEPERRERFRLQQHGLRRDCGGRPTIDLPEAVLDAEFERDVATRRSTRTFSQEPVPACALAGLLGRLRQIESEDGKRRLYGSGGGLYPVQVYAHVREGRVDGVGGGFYYYDPAGHRLFHLSDGEVDRSAHWPANRQIFDGAAFSLFLVADVAAIAPLYGAYSRDLCLLEAGAMTHALLTAAHAHGIGLCQIGFVDLKRVAPRLRLGDEHIPVGSLVGGALSADHVVDGTGRRGGPSGTADSAPGGRHEAKVPILAATDTLAREARLDAEIDPSHAAAPIAVLPERILLTGATGFLGSFLLRELLERTSARITCLVRAHDAAHAAHRLRDALSTWELPCDELDDRVVATPSDLTENRLGLSAREYDRLAEEIDTVYHNAAHVNWVYPYARLKGANVEATRELLRLACAVRRKPFHFTSSLAVFPFCGTTFAEDALLEHGHALYGGYPQSKWVAERLVTIAAGRGLPVSIYRPGTITGDSEQGRFNPTAYIESMIKGSIQIGSVPRLDTIVEMVPVDYAARALCRLSLDGPSLGGMYHLVNPSSLHMNELVHWMRTFGYPLECHGFESWKEQLFATPDFAANALYPFAFFLADLSEEKSMMAPGDCRNTLARLSETDVQCPPADDALLSTYFEAYLRSGFLPPP